MVDCLEADPGRRRGGLDRPEVDLPPVCKAGGRIYKPEYPAAHAPDRWNLQLILSLNRLNAFRAKTSGSLNRRSCIVDPEGDVTDSCPVNLVGGMGRS